MIKFELESEEAFINFIVDRFNKERNISIITSLDFLNAILDERCFECKSLEKEVSSEDYIYVINKNTDRHDSVYLDIFPLEFDCEGVLETEIENELVILEEGLLETEDIEYIEAEEIIIVDYEDDCECCQGCCDNEKEETPNRNSKVYQNGKWQWKSEEEIENEKSTFNDNKIEGHEDILNSVDNLITSLNYLIKSKEIDEEEYSEGEFDNDCLGKCETCTGCEDTEELTDVEVIDEYLEEKIQEFTDLLDESVDDEEFCFHCNLKELLEQIFVFGYEKGKKELASSLGELLTEIVEE